MGGTSGGRDQIYPPCRGADQLPRGAGIDQPGTQRHDPRARSVRGLSRLLLGRRIVARGRVVGRRIVGRRRRRRAVVGRRGLIGRARIGRGGLRGDRAVGGGRVVLDLLRCALVGGDLRNGSGG